MFKLIVALPLFFAAVSAGLIGSPIAYGASPYAYGASPYAAVAHAPIAYSAPAVIKTAAYAAPATSYSNTYRVSQSVAPAIVKSYAAAPAISYAAPSIGIAHGYAAPALSYAHAPALSYAHAPAYASYGSYIH